MSTDIDHLAEAKKLILPRTDYDMRGIEHTIAPGTETDRAIIHALIAIAERLPKPKPHSTHYQ